MPCFLSIVLIFVVQRSPLLADSWGAFQGGLVPRPYRRRKAGVEGEWVVLVNVIASNVYMKKTLQFC